MRTTDTPGFKPFTMKRYFAEVYVPRSSFIKLLMTGPKGSSERNVEVEGGQNSLFPAGSVIKCVVILSNSKNIKKETAKKIVCLTTTSTQICHGFKEHDLITCESKVVSLGS